MSETDHGDDGSSPDMHIEPREVWTRQERHHRKSSSQNLLEQGVPPPGSPTTSGALADIPESSMYIENTSEPSLRFRPRSHARTSSYIPPVYQSNPSPHLAFAQPMGFQANSQHRRDQSASDYYFLQSPYTSPDLSQLDVRPGRASDTYRGRGHVRGGSVTKRPTANLSYSSSPHRALDDGVVPSGYANVNIDTDTGSARRGSDRGETAHEVYSESPGKLQDDVSLAHRHRRKGSSKWDSNPPPVLTSSNPLRDFRGVGQPGLGIGLPGSQQPDESSVQFDPSKTSLPTDPGPSQPPWTQTPPWYVPHNSPHNRSNLGASAQNRDYSQLSPVSAQSAQPSSVRMTLPARFPPSSTASSGMTADVGFGPDPGPGPLVGSALAQGMSVDPMPLPLSQPPPPPPSFGDLTPSMGQLPFMSPVPYVPYAQQVAQSRLRDADSMSPYDYDEGPPQWPYDPYNTEPWQETLRHQYDQHASPSVGRNPPAGPSGPLQLQAEHSIPKLPTPQMPNFLSGRADHPNAAFPDSSQFLGTPSAQPTDSGGAAAQAQGGGPYRYSPGTYALMGETPRPSQMAGPVAPMFGTLRRQDNEEDDQLMAIPGDNYDGDVKEEWPDDAVDDMLKLLEGAERYKWKYLSDLLTKRQNKRIPLRACKNKFEALFGEPEASSLLRSSLFYVAYRSGWDTIKAERIDDEHGDVASGAGHIGRGETAPEDSDADVASSPEQRDDNSSDDAADA